MLQIRFSSADPNRLQFFSPPLGFGPEHVLNRFCMPPPHRILQPPQKPHCEYPPSAERLEYHVSYKNNLDKLHELFFIF